METLYEAFLDSAGICTDSRNAVENMIFFALKGASFDGNKFTGDALERGCKLAVIDNPDTAKGKNYLLVDDVLETLQNLALFHRKKLKIPIIGITGSNGKTTTKELIHSVLSRKFNTLSTEGNLNNHIGVPLTILKIRDQEIAVIEMGANHPGEIDFLCRIALPGYGIITNIGKAHLEGFGSFEGVKKTKSELYHFLSEAGGTAFVNGSNEILAELSSNKHLRKVYYMGGSNPL
ncbi:MAG: UDP-N-acetylmuramoyl-tripeptide--D-alanyl-D-alanine ligase, partial [Bacteroidales bacterium]|nr:UDP-N-acetylmuramoyl-tripeptide--D-alanyl-D-alanine ligase [Bacteroidales bacterium]